MPHLFGFMVEQGAHPFVQVLFGAMVGVQGDGDVGVFRRDFVGEGREGKRTGDAIVHALAGQVGGTAYGDLDDAIGFRFGETLQGGVQGLCAGHVDCGVRVPATTGSVQHLCVTFRCCNSHASIIARPYPTCHVTTFAIAKAPGNCVIQLPGAWLHDVRDDAAINIGNRLRCAVCLTVSGRWSVWRSP